MTYTDNPQLQLAYNFLQYTNRNIFLTGKAGTGKTTFLKRLQQESPKRMIVLAPTGVAAINAGGVTIHSFFQIPFGPYIQGFTRTEEKPKFNFSKQKINIIRTLDLLVIDEISMVRADLLDAIDDVLRRYRANSQPFGGVQLLMIGDLHQLAPVVRDDDWELLKQNYQTMYFFGSNALAKTDYITIELKQVYRQNSQQFVDLLNHVRNNTADTKVFAELNKRYQPNFQPKANDGYITLTTHNYQSNEINQEQLKKLKGKLEKFTADIEGNFPEQMYPTDETLELKEGAQVMFVKNDTSAEKQYFNGKIGRIVNIEDEVIYVHCDDDKMIEVSPVEWENTSYLIDSETKEIKEKVDGIFRQYPLKLAWAITIHKSQGLTFDKVIIDAAQAFSHGQVYVALSRCRTLEGIVLSSQLGSNCLINDSQVSQFNQAAEQAVIDESTLKASRMKYERTLIADLFNCTSIFSAMQNTQHLFARNANTLLGNYDKKIEELLPKFKAEIVTVSANFDLQIAQLLSKGLCDKNDFLQERIGKGCNYFYDKLQSLVVEPFTEISVSTDNSDVEKNANEQIDKLTQLTSEKMYCLNAMKEKFGISEYLKARALAALQDDKKTKKKQKKASNADVPTNHKELYLTLCDWRREVADEMDMPIFYILPQKAIIETANTLPENIEQLKKIKGIGAVKARRFGKDILDIVRQYKLEHNILNDTSIDMSFDELDKIVEAKKSKKKNAKKEQKEPKIDSHKLTFDMYIAGKSIEQIAAVRGLALSTIIGHLSYYIASGELEPTEFIEVDKVETIANYFKSADDHSLKLAKEALGDDYSYGELKMVKAWVDGVVSK